MVNIAAEDVSIRGSVKAVALDGKIFKASALGTKDIASRFVGPLKISTGGEIPACGDSYNWITPVASISALIRARKYGR